MDRFQARKIALRMSNLGIEAADNEEIAELTTVLMASQIRGFPYPTIDATLSMLKSERDRITPRQLVRACLERPVVANRPALSPPEDESGVALKPIYFPDRPNGREPFPIAEPDERERERMRYFYAASPLPACVVNRPDLGIEARHIERANAERRLEANDLEDKIEPLMERQAELSPEERAIVARAQDKLDRLRHALGEAPAPLSPARRLFARSLVRIGRLMVADGNLKCAGCGKRDLDAGDLEGAVAALMEAGSKGARGGHVYCTACRRPAPPEPPDASAWLDPEVGLPPDELARLIDEEKERLKT